LLNVKLLVHHVTSRLQRVKGLSHKDGTVKLSEMSVPNLGCATFQKIKDIGYNLGGDYTGLLCTLVASE
jgi:hypothetical protein